MNWDIEKLNKEVEGFSAEEIVSWAVKKFGSDKLTLASSFSIEDQTLTDMVVKSDKKVKVFTLDTGRLFPETYNTMQETRDKYGISIEAYFPDAREVEEMQNSHGPNLMYSSLENRKLCCGVRKINPLRRALKGFDGWIVGLRREHSPERGDVSIVEWDTGNGLVKINPLASWSTEQVWEYIKKEKIPYNVLQDKGFISLGCAPCTRAVFPGEDFRSGRWWWETGAKRECGLHNNPNRKKS